MLICSTQIVGCRRHTDEPSAQIRFIDGVQDADTLWLSVQHQMIFGNRTFGSASDYVNVPAQSYSVHASANREGLSPFELPPVGCTLQQGQKYTSIAVGSVGMWPRAHLQIFEDDPVMDLADSQAEIRVIDAYPHSTKIDVIFNNIVAFKSLTFGSRSAPIVLPAKQYIGQAIEAGTYTNQIVQQTPLDLSGGKAYELVIIGPNAPSRPGMILIEDQ